MPLKSIEPLKLKKDLKTLALFVSLYCHHQHAGAEKCAPRVNNLDIDQIAGRPLLLCGDCRKLLAHALVKRSHCPMNPKPACKHCPAHCYHATYRAQIRQVMRFSGRKMLLGGRLDYLFHLLF
jgi:hypothetical protein